MFPLKVLVLTFCWALKEVVPLPEASTMALLKTPLVPVMLREPPCLEKVRVPVPRLVPPATFRPAVLETTVPPE